jgi:uncharacterized protein YjiS (DUF1127 family)
MVIAIREELPIRTRLAYASGITWKEFLGNIRALSVLAMAEWRRRVRMRNELITLCDGDLRDIGWTRAEVDAECRKPFWQA